MPFDNNPERQVNAFSRDFLLANVNYFRVLFFLLDFVKKCGIIITEQP